MTLDVIDRMVRQANPVPDPTELEPAELDDSELGGAEVVVIGRPRSSERAGRARRLVLTAAATALVAIAGTLLVRAGTDDAPTEVPTDPGPSPSPTTRSEAGGAGLLPAAGSTPSRPERGELVASVGSSARGTAGESSFNLYADGRLLRVGRILLGDRTTSRYGGQLVEQRLTPEGVELVRSEFLAAGLVGPGRSRAAAVAFNSCVCVIRVREGGRLLSTEAPPSGSDQLDPRVDRRVDRLIEYILQIESRLPASAWAVRDWIPYVPSRYQLCVMGGADENGAHQPVTDAVTTFRRHVPDPIARLLARANDTGNCPLLAFERTREVAEALDAAGATHGGYGGMVTYRIFGPSPGPDPTLAYIGLYPLLPDGQPPLTVGS